MTNMSWILHAPISSELPFSDSSTGWLYGPTPPYGFCGKLKPCVADHSPCASRQERRRRGLFRCQLCEVRYFGDMLGIYGLGMMVKLLGLWTAGSEASATHRLHNYNRGRNTKDKMRRVRFGEGASIRSMGVRNESDRQDVDRRQGEGGGGMIVGIMRKRSETPIENNFIEVMRINYEFQEASIPSLVVVVLVSARMWSVCGSGSWTRVLHHQLR